MKIIKVNLKNPHLAVQWDGDMSTADDLYAWSGGRVDFNETTGNLELRFRTFSWPLEVGDWILKDHESRFHNVSKKDFAEDLQEVGPYEPGREETEEEREGL